MNFTEIKQNKCVSQILIETVRTVCVCVCVCVCDNSKMMNHSQFIFVNRLYQIKFC